MGGQLYSQDGLFLIKLLYFLIAYNRQNGLSDDDPRGHVRVANAKGSPPSEACFLFSLTCTKVDWGLAFADPRFTQGCKCKRQHPAGVVFLFCFRSPKGIAFRSLQQNKKATLLRGLLHLPVIPLGTHIFSESLYLQGFHK